MRDKDLVALLTLAAFILYLYPLEILKFVSIAILIFFSPGFFLLKILYRDMKLEELVLLSFGVSLAFSGAVALLLAIFGALRPEYLLITVASISTIGYFLSSSLDLELRKLEKPDRFTSLMIVMMLILIALWGYFEIQTTPYREVDIAINSWTKNATLNSSLNFEIYVKNWNYGSANCTVVFSLNGYRVDSRSFHLEDGDSQILIFHAIANRTGKNLASFDLYINGSFYTNVHLYFRVSEPT